MSDLTNTLTYFWEQRGDIERWVGYDEAVLAKEAPHVLIAWKNYLASRQLMDAAITSLSNSIVTTDLNFKEQ